MFTMKLNTSGLIRLGARISCWFVLAACVSCAKEPDAEPAKPSDDAKEPKVVELKLEADEVIRHAVFFKFKDESSKEDIQGVVDAFRELPSKIPEIIDFSWGVNNSPEDFDDGFTHCFLLTFADDAGRKVYLPHDDHRAFGNVLRPHMEDVFVIDYVGDKNDKDPEKALKHAVFFKFKEGSTESEIQKVEEEFAALPGKIDTIKAFEWGRNNSPENHDDGFTHCFMVTFDSEKGREAYLPHTEHLDFVRALEPILEQPRVLDFWAEK